MALSALPLDVLDALCVFVPNTDLLAVAVASSTLLPLARRHISRNVALHDPDQAVQCLDMLSGHPELFRSVRTFSLRLDSRAGPKTGFSLQAARVRDALKRMVGLRELDLVVAPSDGSVIFEGFDRPSVRFPRLTHFSTNFALDALLCAFLEQTPALQELELGEDSLGVSNPSSPLLSKSALPNLSHFMGSAASSCSLVPGRPLQSVHLYSTSAEAPSSSSSEEELGSNVLSALAQSTGPVTVFGALTRSLSPSTVRGLAQALPHLNHLRIMTMYHAQALHHPDEAFYAEVVRTLSTLPELATAELAGIRWAPRKSADSNSIKAASARLPDAAAEHAMPAPNDLHEYNDHAPNDAETENVADNDLGLYLS